MPRTSTFRRIYEIVLQVPPLKLEMDLCKKKHVKEAIIMFSKTKIQFKFGSELFFKLFYLG